ncbi:Lysophospholipase L1 [Granulicella pectinivorans]|jgi:lysophospholipase L1-like esterase|uniref:Lysophospholipase L1 n=1 Tax=Granulicella pectinivorans TaxID=474950 RepID=A0A1I6MCL5_9BACT|nr:rhamnogalacturonan acetylesterase [Granulicella pectinivorans]SFS13328.1 Lysophospholipase L1 [Granulicella pectinivorans]
MKHLLLAAALLLLPAAALAQNTPDAPPQTAVPTDAPLNPSLPTLFIVGDSTARNKLDLGWGDHFAHFFDTSRINIANRAVAGRSSRTYLVEGRWATTLAQVKAGDFVLIQMGHNDGAGTPESVQKDLKARSSLKGLGNETVEVTLPGKPTETVRTYGSYLRQYIAETRARGATPILLTVTIRNIWKDGHIERDMGFRDYETQLAATEHVPLIDMATCAADRFEALGPEKTALLFPIDHTHTSPEGAEINAGCVAQALRTAKSPVAAYLR